MSPIGLLAAVALAPWLQPLAFRPLPGWQTGASGNTRSIYVGPGKHVVAPLESTAWIARNVRYRDNATADPPNTTLAHLPANAVIIWSVIPGLAHAGEKPIQLDLGKARHFPCCEAVGLVGGEYELAGNGPGRAHFVIVRIYFGSRPTAAARAEAAPARVAATSLTSTALSPNRWARVQPQGFRLCPLVALGQPQRLGEVPGIAGCELLRGDLVEPLPVERGHEPDSLLNNSVLRV